MTMRQNHPVRAASDGRRGASANRAPHSNAPLYAALDLGTNSCRMLIAEPDGGHFRVVDAFSKSVRLGVDLERSGALSQSGINRTLQALHVCSRKLKKLRVKNMRLVATEACRRASNGEKFLARVRNETGLNLEIIDPSEEARLAVISCAPLLEQQTEQVLVVDIGGGSTELVWIDLSEVAPEERAAAMIGIRPGAEHIEGEARVVDWISVPLGVATLMHRFSDVETDGARFALMSCFFEEALEEFAPYLETNTPNLATNFQVIGTSGTVTTLGAMHLGLRRYDRNKVDGLRMTSGEVDFVIEKFLSLGVEGRRMEPGIGRDRADLILSGSAILQTLLRIRPTDYMRVADRGLREGMLFSMMNADGVLTNPVDEPSDN